MTKRSGYRHSGFSVGVGAGIEARYRAGLEGLKLWWARPPFTMD